MLKIMLGFLVFVNSWNFSVKFISSLIFNVEIILRFLVSCQMHVIFG